MTYSDNDSWEKFEDDDDPYSPPSSPPPPHIILYPENYHAGSGKSWQHDYASHIPRHSSSQIASTSSSYYNRSPLHPSSSSSSSSESDAKRNNNSKISSSNRYFKLARKQTFHIFKGLLKFIFSNNNILLMVTLANRLWRSRHSIVIKPYYHFLKQVKDNIPSNYQEALLLFNVVRSLALSYYVKAMSHSTKVQHTGGGGVVKRNKHAVLFVLLNIQKLYTSSTKQINKWIAQTIRSIGGLDALILAIGTITFTKYLQRSNRIF